MELPYPLVVWGQHGRMGRQLLARLGTERWANRFRLVDPGGDWGHESVMTVVDFSTPEGNEALRHKLSRWSGRAYTVVGTTGLGDAAPQQWARMAGATLFAPNTSIGVKVFQLLTRQLATQIAQLGYDFEVHEIHHRHKRDHPSGTALSLVASLQEVTGYVRGEPLPGEARAPERIGVTWSRGGGVVGEHRVSALGEHDEITLIHRVGDRSCFAEGALQLALWLTSRKTEGIVEWADLPSEAFTSLAASIAVAPFPSGGICDTVGKLP